MEITFISCRASKLFDENDAIANTIIVNGRRAFSEALFKDARCGWARKDIPETRLVLHVTLFQQFQCAAHLRQEMKGGVMMKGGKEGVRTRIPVT